MAVVTAWHPELSALHPLRQGIARKHGNACETEPLTCQVTLSACGYLRASERHTYRSLQHESRSGASTGDDSDAETGVIYTSISLAVANKSRARCLDLSGSSDMVCTNLLCEKVGGPCTCR